MNPEPLTRWLGIENVAHVIVGNTGVSALLDSGARVNTITPALVDLNGLDVFSLTDLVGDEPLTLNGVGGCRTVPVGYTIIRVRCPEISGYDEDQVALVIPDDSEFASRVPLVLGTPALKRMVNVIRESELDQLSTPWAIIRTSVGLANTNSQRYPSPRVNRVEIDPQQMTTTLGTSPQDLDEIATVRQDIEIPPLTTRLIKIKIKTQLRGCKAHVCVTDIDSSSGPQPPAGIHVDDSYHVLNPCTNALVALIRNESGDHITLRKGKPIARVVLANEEPMSLIKSDMLDAIDFERGREVHTGTTHPSHSKLSVEQRKAKLLSTLDLSGLQSWSKDEANRAKKLLSDFHDIFSLEPLELGETKMAEHDIKLTDSEPFKERFRRIPPPLVDEVREHLREMLDADVIQPSKSPWANAVVLVRKKDGGLRFCIDFRRLNARTIADSYALPRINEALDELRGMAQFSCLDLISGFWQIPMSAKSRPYTAFTVGNLGFYECKRMPFGLMNAPATFQRAMEECMGDLNLKICLIYLDDLICYSKSIGEHLDRLRQVFERLRISGLKLKPEKCKFFQSEITYLGHRVSKDGIHPSDDNVRAIRESPVPSNFTDIRSFVSSVSAYRRFIKNFSQIAGPLYDHLRGDNAKKKSESVQLSPEALDARLKLIEAITTAPVLVPPDFTKPFRLETDASLKGLGAVLSQQHDADQKHHPISFGSTCLKGSQKNYHSSKLEFFALHWAVTKQFKDYLYWSTFTVRTDNNPLTYVNSTAKLDAVGHRWVADLASFHFNLEYVRGKENVVADFLSRQPVPDSDSDTSESQTSNPDRKPDTQVLDEKDVKETLDGATRGTDHRADVYNPFIIQLRMAIEREEEIQAKIAQNTQLHVIDWKAAQRDDPLIRGTLQWISGDKKQDLPDVLGPVLSRSVEGQEYIRNKSRFRLHNGLLYLFTQPRVKKPNGEYIDALDTCNAFVVPTDHRKSAIRGCHDLMGHQGRDRTLSLVRERFWWPGMHSMVTQQLQKCPRCRLFKAKPSTEELFPILVTAPLELVHVDYTTIEMVRDKGDVPEEGTPKVLNVLVIQDHFTKFLVVKVTPDQTAKTTARYLWEEFFSIFSPPARLISDQGRNFTSKIVTELCDHYCLSPNGKWPSRTSQPNHFPIDSKFVKG